jgi:hypothetical protein
MISNLLRKAGTLVLTLLFCGLNHAFGQVTIASEGFNNSSTLFTITGTGNAYYTGNSGTGNRPASAAYAIEGSHAYGRSAGSGSGILIFPFIQHILNFNFVLVESQAFSCSHIKALHSGHKADRSGKK